MKNTNFLKTVVFTLHDNSTVTVADKATGAHKGAGTAALNAYKSGAMVDVVTEADGVTSHKLINNSAILYAVVTQTTSETTVTDAVCGE